MKTITIYDIGCGIVRGFDGTIGNDDDKECMLSSYTPNHDMVEFAKSIAPDVTEIDIVSINTVLVKKLVEGETKNFNLYVETAEDVEIHKQMTTALETYKMCQRKLQKHLVD